LANDHFLESQVALSERATSLEQQLDAVKEAAGFVSKSLTSKDPQLDSQLQIAELEHKLAQSQEAGLAKLTKHDTVREKRTASMAKEFATAQGQWHQQKKQLVSEIQAQRTQLIAWCSFSAPWILPSTLDPAMTIHFQAMHGARSLHH
jgi:hypothetical protein